MPKRDEQTPGRNPNPQPSGDDFGQPDDERDRSDRDAEEEDEEL